MYTPEAAVAVLLVTVAALAALVLLLLARWVGRAWSRRGAFVPRPRGSDPVEMVTTAVGATALTALLMGILAFGIQGPLHLAGALAALLLVALVAAWFREFGFLMQLHDDAFPGRFDKPIWGLLLILLPPVGVVMFRSFRKAYWPEAKPADARMLHELG